MSNCNITVLRVPPRQWLTRGERYRVLFNGRCDARLLNMSGGLPAHVPPSIVRNAIAAGDFIVEG